MPFDRTGGQEQLSADLGVVQPSAASRAIEASCAVSTVAVPCAPEANTTCPRNRSTRALRASSSGPAAALPAALAGCQLVSHFLEQLLLHYQPIV